MLSRPSTITHLISVSAYVLSMGISAPFESLALSKLKDANETTVAQILESAAWARYIRCRGLLELASWQSGIGLVVEFVRLQENE